MDRVFFALGSLAAFVGVALALLAVGWAHTRWPSAALTAGGWLFLAGSARSRRSAASPSSPDGYASPGRRGRRNVRPMRTVLAVCGLLFNSLALAIDLDAPARAMPAK